MRLKSLFAFAVVAAVALACGPKKPVAPGPWPIQPSDSSECKAMCDHLKSLPCEEGEDVYNSDLPGPRDVPNQSCTAWCEEMQSRGVFLNPRCVKQVPSCDAIEEYRTKTCTD